MRRSVPHWSQSGPRQVSRGVIEQTLNVAAERIWQANLASCFWLSCFCSKLLDTWPLDNINSKKTQNSNYITLHLFKSNIKACIHLTFWTTFQRSSKAYFRMGQAHRGLRQWEVSFDELKKAFLKKSVYLRDNGIQYLCLLILYWTLLYFYIHIFNFLLCFDVWCLFTKLASTSFHNPPEGSSGCIQRRSFSRADKQGAYSWWQGRALFGCQDVPGINWLGQTTEWLIHNHLLVRLPL